MEIWALASAIPLAVLFIVLQIFMHNYFETFGVYLGVSQKRSKKEVKSNLFLTNFFYNKRSNVSEQQKETLPKLQHQDANLEKFCECCFRVIYYTVSFTFGLAISWNRPCRSDLRECWTNFPNFELDYAIWAHYVLAVSFYLLDLVKHLFFLRAKRDFLAMISHHIAATVVLVLSWKAGSANIGSIILTLHDGSDLLLDLAKAANYAKKKTISYVVFALFVLYWFTLRMSIYPFWILRHMFFELMEVVPAFAWYYETNGILLILHSLNCYWSYLIVKMILRSLKTGKMEGDIRSDDEQKID